MKWAKVFNQIDESCINSVELLYQHRIIEHVVIYEDDEKYQIKNKILKLANMLEEAKVELPLQNLDERNEND